MKRSNFSVIGKPGLHDKQSVDCACGINVMADDVFLGTKLFAAQLGSKYAYCKVTKIDASKALALPGVVAVVDHTEVPGWSDVKLFQNDGVACVAATSQNIAMRALELIDVTYEQRTAVIDPDEAMKPGASLTGIYPDSNTNTRTEVNRGNLEAGFKAAEVTVEYDLGYSNPHPPPAMGGGSCTAWWTKEDEVNIFVDTQNIHSECRGVAASFKLPYNKVRGWTKGNGTGMGSGRVPIIPQAVALAKKTGRPVALHADRNLQQRNGGHQFPIKSKTKIGAKKDGTITAVDFTYWADQGINTGAPITGGHQLWQHIFPIPNAHFKCIGIATNTTMRWHYRCVAHPGGSFNMNLALDKLAGELKMDPVALRQKNFAEPGGPVMDTTKPQPYSLDTMKERFAEVVTLMNYDKKKHEHGKNNVLPDGRLHGIAITGHRDGHGGGPSTGRGALVHMRPDGTAWTNLGMSRVGAGTPSLHCHIIAEVLGIDYEDVGCTFGEYHVSPDGGSQTGSSNTPSHGAAVYVAAMDAQAQLFATAAGMFTPKVSPEDLDAANRKIFLKTDPTKFVTHAAVCAKNPRIIGKASDNWGPTLTRPHYGYKEGDEATQLPVCVTGIEVAVDPETGEVEITNLTYLTDIGRIMFHEGAFSQAEAGCDHVVAQSIYWDSVWDIPTGYLLTDHLWQTPMPTSLDLPLEAYHPYLREGDSATGPFGATGMGEPCSGNHNAVNMAVCNAIGTYITTGPLRPWIVLKAMGKV
jgi:CO/xanthine dehydrogenase Mo-binding subunit